MVPPCFAPTLMSLRTSAHTGVAISIESRGASKRFNGRTRGCLPIDTPAPRPCSADPDPPHHTNRGSLKGFACVLFSSQLLQIYDLIIQSKNPIVNRKMHIIIRNTSENRCHCEERSDVAISCRFDRISQRRLPRRSGNALPPRNDTHFTQCVFFPSPRTAPRPQQQHRPPAFPRSWAKSSPAQTLPRIPGDRQTRRPPTPQTQY